MTNPPITVKEILSRCYKAIMSNGDDISIDANEIDLVQRAINAGTFIRVRQGIINPSYLVSIVEDKKRRVEFLENTKYSDERSTALRAAGMRPLSDIFSKHVPRLTAGPPGEEKGRTLPEQTPKAI